MIKINEFKDLNNYSIQELIDAKPEELQGNLITQMDAMFKSLHDKAPTTQPLSISTINKPFEAKRITFEINKKINLGENIFIRCSLNDWKDLPLTCSNESIWQISIDSISHENVEYIFHINQDKWMNGGNRKFDLNEVMERFKTDSKGQEGSSGSKEKFEFYLADQTLKVILKEINF